VKKLFTILLFSLIAFNSPAQIAVKLYQFRPSGDFGSVMGRSVTAELLFIGEFKHHKRMRFGLTYVALHARLDTFPITVISSEYPNVMPGTMVYKHYRVLIGNMGFDYGFLDNDIWTPYAGFDIIAGATDVAYNKNDIIVNTDYSGGEVLVGFRFRAGVEYTFKEKYGVFLEIARAMYLLSDKTTLAHNDFGLGFRYKFN